MKRDKKTRYLKIHTRWVKSWSGLISRKAVPEIRLSGIWLLQEGFFPKDKIKVVVRKRFLGIEFYQPIA